MAADAKGEVTEVRLEILDRPLSFKDGPLVFKVKTTTHRGVVQYLVDPAGSGTLLTKKHYWFVVDTGRITDGPGLSLEQAVANAEQATGERAVGAALKATGAPLYLVRVNNGHAFRTVFVDPESGSVYRNQNRGNEHS